MIDLPWANASVGLYTQRKHLTNSDHFVPAQGRLVQDAQPIVLPISKECTCFGSSVNSTFSFNCFHEVRGCSS